MSAREDKARKGDMSEATRDPIRNALGGSRGLGMSQREVVAEIVNARRAATRPHLLDLFCKAGGATKGYHMAGFNVTGVDIELQPNYPGPFHQRDALEVLRGIVAAAQAGNYPRFAAIHASPPCQSGTAYRRKGHGVGDDYPNLIPEVRELLIASGIPYVIENVVGMREHLRDPIQLCGSSFGLDVQRHRLFESNVPLIAPPCDHSWQTPRFPAATNRKPNSRRTVEVGVWRIPLNVQQRAMGIDWMTLPELSEAIPPAYTSYIGCQIHAYLTSNAKLAG